MPYIHEDFLLHTKTARRLYHEYAAQQPILDYHCHLSPEEIAEDRTFKDLFEIWLEGDHYKWRAMRANGIAERFCTGDAPPYEKFAAWAATVPHCLRNPLYHWTHLELKRYFEIDELLNPASAQKIWKRASEDLAKPEMSARGILAKFDVRALCTTDDPTSDLQAHAKIAASKLPTRVYPAFRPDRALAVDQPDAFNAWVGRLEQAADVAIDRFAKFLDALRKRHDAFHAMGCRLSDHGLPHCYAECCSEQCAAEFSDRARAGLAATPVEHSRYASFLMAFFGHLDAEKGWTKQLHLGARRSVNSRALATLGPDTGFDSIGDWPQAAALCAYLDILERDNALPKMIVYNVNPSDNYTIVTALGSFQDGAIPGKIQLGSGWWYLDQKEGMEWQLNALSNVGLLSRFVGMLTDSRSFMSYPRHEYFRRVLCNLLGREMESGELPNDEKLVGGMVRDICFGNAFQYFGLEADGDTEPKRARVHV
jgi:glucuronate isomerase